MNDKRRRITLTSVYAISHEKPKLVDNLDTSSRSSLSSSQCVMLYLKKKILNISATAYDWLAAIKGELRIARTYLKTRWRIVFSLEDWKQFFTLTLISPFTSQWLVRLPSRMAFHTKKEKKTRKPELHGVCDLLPIVFGLQMGGVSLRKLNVVSWFVS